MTAHPRSASSGNNAPSTPTSARIDVWLWSVQQIKSRSTATGARKAGHVRVNGETAKPTQHVSVGDKVRYRVNDFSRLLTVTRILTRRMDAPIVRTAYIDSSPPLPSPLDAPAAVIRDREAGRPMKKEYRQLDVLMGGGRHQDGRV